MHMKYAFAVFSAVSRAFAVVFKAIVFLQKTCINTLAEIF